ncbi:MAG: TraM recognition domain-containing protein [Chloroflexi bacterium]|nr:TraM recognition domain-containing protein [Chloroflexota bacterium]
MPTSVAALLDGHAAQLAFRRIVEEVFPHTAGEILAAHRPGERREHARVAAFVNKVGVELFPVYEVEEYEQVIGGIPFARNGFGYERWHDFDLQAGELLLSTLCAPAYDDDARLALLDAAEQHVPCELLTAIPECGLSPTDLHARLDGTPYAAAADFADWQWGQTETILTKVHRFAGSRAARSIVGQPRSTIDPSGWLDTGAIVVVNTAKGTVGEDTAALIGGTLINLVGLLVGEQARLSESGRRPVTLIVDEFHTMAGADYEAILSELAKYGASLVLATQSLARLEALDREQGRSQRATVFANLDGLFAFHTSAEDARYLVRELGGEVDEHDLIELGEHQCYARLSAGGERLPTFSLALDRPPASDPVVRGTLTELSAARYGREANAVENDLRSALARIEGSRSETQKQEQRGRKGSISDRSWPPTGAGSSTERHQQRSQHRDEKHGRRATPKGTSVDGSRKVDAADSPAVLQVSLPMDDPAGEPTEAAT